MTGSQVLKENEASEQKFFAEKQGFNPDRFKPMNKF